MRSATMLAGVAALAFAGASAHAQGSAGAAQPSAPPPSATTPPADSTTTNAPPETGEDQDATRTPRSPEAQGDSSAAEDRSGDQDRSGYNERSGYDAGKHTSEVERQPEGQTPTFGTTSSTAAPEGGAWNYAPYGPPG